MPCIKGRHHGRAALVPAAIIDAARYKQHKEALAPLLSGVRPYRALIDTGATSTMISERVRDDLGLQPVTKIPFHSLDGLTFRDACLFHVAFYENLKLDDLGAYNGEPGNIFICKKVVTGGILSNGASFDVLIGMDIISTWAMTFSSDGGFEFSF